MKMFSVRIPKYALIWYYIGIMCFENIQCLSCIIFKTNRETTQIRS